MSSNTRKTFICPSCNAEERLILVEYRYTYTCVSNLSILDNEWLDINDYGDIDHGDPSESYYQCENCGFNFEEFEIIKILKENQENEKDKEDWVEI